MKKLLLILGSFFLFWSCDREDNEILLVKNASITIDEPEVDNCRYTIRTEDREFYTTDQLPGSYSETTFDAKITYRTTKEASLCGFGGSLFKIEILELVKL